MGGGGRRKWVGGVQKGRGMETRRGQVALVQRRHGDAREAVEEGAGQALAPAPLPDRVLAAEQAERRGALKLLTTVGEGRKRGGGGGGGRFGRERRRVIQLRVRERERERGTEERGGRARRGLICPYGCVDSTPAPRGGAGAIRIYYQKSTMV